MSDGALGAVVVADGVDEFRRHAPGFEQRRADLPVVLAGEHQVRQFGAAGSMGDARVGKHEVVVRVPLDGQPADVVDQAGDKDLSGVPGGRLLMAKCSAMAATSTECRHRPLNSAEGKHRP